MRRYGRRRRDEETRAEERAGRGPAGSGCLATHPSACLPAFLPTCLPPSLTRARAHTHTLPATPPPVLSSPPRFPPLQTHLHQVAAVAVLHQRVAPLLGYPFYSLGGGTAQHVQQQALLQLPARQGKEGRRRSAGGANGHARVYGGWGRGASSPRAWQQLPPPQPPRQPPPPPVTRLAPSGGARSARPHPSPQPCSPGPA